MKCSYSKRFFAYVIDMLIIVALTYLFTFFIPASNKYEEAVESNNAISEKYYNGEIGAKEFLKEYANNSVIINKEGFCYTLIQIVIIIAYYGTYAYYNDGKTIGKKINHIKVESKDGKKVSHIRLIFRSIILYELVFSVLELILSFVLNKNYFIMLVGLEFANYIFNLLIIVFVLFSKDGRGLHDIICNTKVVEE